MNWGTGPILMGTSSTSVRPTTAVTLIPFHNSDYGLWAHTLTTDDLYGFFELYKIVADPNALYGYSIQILPNSKAYWYPGTANTITIGLSGGAGTSGGGQAGCIPISGNVVVVMYSNNAGVPGHSSQWLRIVYRDGDTISISDPQCLVDSYVAVASSVSHSVTRIDDAHFVHSWGAGNPASGFLGDVVAGQSVFDTCSLYGSSVSIDRSDVVDVAPPGMAVQSPGQLQTVLSFTGDALIGYSSSNFLFVNWNLTALPYTLGGGPDKTSMVAFNPTYTSFIPTQATERYGGIVVTYGTGGQDGNPVWWDGSSFSQNVPTSYLGYLMGGRAWPNLNQEYVTFNVSSPLPVDKPLAYAVSSQNASGYTFLEGGNTLFTPKTITGNASLTNHRISGLQAVNHGNGKVAMLIETDANFGGSDDHWWGYVFTY